MKINIIEFKRKTKIQNFSYSPLPDRVVLMGGRVVLSSLDQSTLGAPLPPPPEHLGVLGLGVTVTFWHLETGTTLSGIKGICLLIVQPRLGRHISVESCIYKNQSTESTKIKVLKAASAKIKVLKTASTKFKVLKTASTKIKVLTTASTKNLSTENCIYKNQSTESCITGEGVLSFSEFVPYPFAEKSCNKI